MRRKITPSGPSVLIIGAAGRTGVACIHHLAMHHSNPEIHAFCQNASNLDPSDWDLCASVLEGSARHAIDIEEALTLTKANWVIICVGTGDDVAPSNIRTFAAENTARLLQKPEFQRVRVMVVSMVRSIGTLNHFHFRYVLADHKGQERAFRKIGDRTTIVRATPFRRPIENSRDSIEISEKQQRRRSSSEASDSSSSSISSAASSIAEAFKAPLSRKRHDYSKSNTSRLVEFGDKKHIPSHNTYRDDLAKWIVEQICEDAFDGEARDKVRSTSGRIVSVTSEIF